MKQRCRRAFTLVELLVVIGIIAILVALLLPSLKKARAHAQMVQCMSGHREIMMAMAQYVNESKGRICPQYIDNDPQPNPGIKPWYYSRYLGKYIGNKVEYTTTTKNESRISLCPAAQTKPGFDRLGIGMNACWDNGFLVTSISGKLLSYSLIRQPARTIMFVDVRDPASTSNLTSYLFEQFYQGDASPRSWSGSGRVVAYRHNKRTVVSFADGHAESFGSDSEDWNSTQINKGLHKALTTGEVKYKAK